MTHEECDGVEATPIPRSATILLIEDDIEIAEMYSVVLRLAGHVVTVAQNGEEGITLAKNRAFDLALVDVGLPKLGGLQVLAALRQLHAQLPVAILTNESNPDLLNRALRLGAVEYVIKSRTTPQALANKVTNWLP